MKEDGERKAGAMICKRPATKKNESDQVSVVFEDVDKEEAKEGATRKNGNKTAKKHMPKPRLTDQQ